LRSSTAKKKELDSKDWAELIAAKRGRVAYAPYTKLLLGDDMSRNSKGVCSVFATAKAITQPQDEMSTQCCSSSCKCGHPWPRCNRFRVPQWRPASPHLCCASAQEIVLRFVAYHGHPSSWVLGVLLVGRSAELGNHLGHFNHAKASKSCLHCVRF
jgi:hypothetical protein